MGKSAITLYEFLGGGNCDIGLGKDDETVRYPSEEARSTPPTPTILVAAVKTGFAAQ
jgi:hypothetical protein